MAIKAHQVWWVCTHFMQAYTLLPSAKLCVFSGYICSSFLCHQRNEAKKMPLKIAAYILTKAGNRAQNKAGVLLLSLLPAFVSAQL